MKNNAEICIIGAYDLLSKSYFKSISKNYKDTCFINLSNDTREESNLYNCKIFELKKILNNLKSNNIKNIIFLGKIIRPNLSEFKNDGIVEKYVPQFIDAFKKGDSSILNTVIDLFREYEYRIISPFKYCDTFNFNKESVNFNILKEDLIDVNKSTKLLNALSKYDNAQSVVSVNGYIIGIEAVEGTDALLKRVYNLRSKLNQLKNKSGFLTKIPKKNQSKLIDLPVIGPKTFELINRANLKGIAIDYKNTIIYKREDVLELKKKYKLQIYNIN